MNQKITVGELVAWLENLFPLSYQESYDNSGLQTGSLTQEITGVLTTLDCTEDVIEEAIKKHCNVIVTHHPVIFSGIKKITGSNAIQRTLITAIKNDIAIYAIHTNLDNTVKNGVNSKIAEVIGLKDTSVLSPLVGELRKLVTFVPLNDLEKIRVALSQSGAGNIGEYDNCSFSVAGEGTFRAGPDANPFVGKIGTLHTEKEYKLEMIFPSHLEKVIVKTLKENHPYEEPAFDILKIENSWEQAGAGLVGELPNEMTENEFLNHLKTRMKTGSIKYTPKNGKIRKVAVCGGSGSFLLKNAISAGADAFVSSDFKYHQFFEAEGRIMIADIGHYESEFFTSELLKDLILKKFTTFAVLLSDFNTNPINYF